MSQNHGGPWFRQMCIGCVLVLKKELNLDITNKDALIIADVQKDFLPGGALGIKNGNQIIPALNDYISIFKQANAKIIASRDWHPSNHMSFTAQGGPWPPHCVQNTEGAEFSPQLKLPANAMIISKATDPSKEAYSVFDGTGLTDQLKEQGITRVFIGGLATDYCVVNSVIDARKAGFETVVLLDAICGIDVTPGDIDRALETMANKGAVQVTLEDFPDPELTSNPDDSQEAAADIPLTQIEAKKKARMRPKGSVRVRRERG